jgi:hypothetical protein
MVDEPLVALAMHHLERGADVTRLLRPAEGAGAAAVEDDQKMPAAELAEPFAEDFHP